MRKTGMFCLAATGLLVAPLMGQMQANQKVIRAVNGGKYTSAQCKLTGGDFRTSSSGTYLKSAADAGDPEVRHGLVVKGLNTATEAVTANQKSAAGWYYLGRAELLLGNIQAADTAFTKAAALAPDCVEDIKGYRQKAWIALVQPGTDFLQKHNLDSALVILREAMVISRDYPQGFFNIAAVFVPLKMNDSALYYFKLAQEKAGSDSKFRDVRQNSTVSIAMIYMQLNQPEQAIPEYRKFLAGKPKDPEATKGLIAALRFTGANDEAAKLEKELIADAGSSGTLSAGDLMSVGINLYNDKKYTEAADAFEKVLTMEPGNRDALYNLSNMYLATKDGPKIVETGIKLVGVDPMNEENLKVLSNGYRMTSDTANMVKYIGVLYALPINVTVTRFSPKKDGAILQGQAVGRDALDMSGKAIAPAALTLNFEFLNAAGAVVTSKEVAVTPLQTGAKLDIAIEVKGEGIVVWRYSKKG